VTLKFLALGLIILLVIMAGVGGYRNLTNGGYKNAELVALIALAVIFVGLFFVAGATLGLQPPAGAPPVWATGLLWSVACLAVGGLLGFIFGVPRAPTLTSLTEPKYTRPSRATGTGGEPERSGPGGGSGASPGAGSSGASGASGPAGLSGPSGPSGSFGAGSHTGSRNVTEASGPSSSEPPYQPNSNLEEISDWLTKILVGMGLSQWPAIKSQLRAIMTLLANGIGGDSAQPLALGIVMYFGTIGFLAVYLLTRLFISSALASQGG
jgi:hypothetical protein